MVQGAPRAAQNIKQETLRNANWRFAKEERQTQRQTSKVIIFPGYGASFGSDLPSHLQQTDRGVMLPLGKLEMRSESTPLLPALCVRVCNSCHVSLDAASSHQDSLKFKV